MTPQTQVLLRYLELTGSITAREALLDLDMTSATLTRRICDLREAGYDVDRVRKVNRATGKRYTEYVFHSTNSLLELDKADITDCSQLFAIVV